MKKRIKIFVKVRLLFAVGLYDLVIKRSFAAEIRGVYLGIREHNRSRYSSGSIYFIRRHTHMLEKGLSMRPRRATFAEGYITELIDQVVNGFRTEKFDDVTSVWVLSVLDDYFIATSTSDSEIIQSARDLYRSIDSGRRSIGGQSRSLGPRQFKSIEHGVSLESLASLSASRESVRWFKSNHVPREIIDSAINIAVESPSACNRLPYRFIVVDDAEDAVKLASLAGGTAGYVENIRALIVVVGDLSAYQSSRDRHLIYTDSGLAVMGLLLGLQSQGVSSCCINWPDLAVADRKMTMRAGLKPWERTVMLVAYGYPDPSGIVPGSGKKQLDAVRKYGLSELRS